MRRRSCCGTSMAGLPASIVAPTRSPTRENRRCRNGNGSARTYPCRLVDHLLHVDADRTWRHFGAASLAESPLRVEGEVRGKLRVGIKLQRLKTQGAGKHLGVLQESRSKTAALLLRMHGNVLDQ